MSRCASSQGFQMKRKISDRLTASSMAAEVRVPGEQDALHVRPAFLHRAQELDAGHARHPVVRHDRLHGLALQDPDRRDRVGRVEDPARRTAQHAVQRAADRLVVLDEEERRLGPGPGLHLSLEMTCASITGGPLGASSDP